MTANVVTFAIQLGSGGFEIAQEIAEKLDYRYLDSEVIARAAELAGVSPDTIAAAERWPTFVERMLERLALTTVVSEGVLPTPPTANPATMMLTSADYRQLVEQVVQSLAAEGRCVIIGHAGQAILRNKPRVFKVLVHGSKDRRAERLASEQGLDMKEAMSQVKDNDRQRIEFFKHVYNIDWLESSSYDMTINTDDVDRHTAVSLIMTGMSGVPSPV
jgi:cytidylate kinase